ncbi:MAG: hypothetical protein DMF56_02215 [Acidobacteria bacterium]|nr:MAG: hypothetical protein DMF56_02215 [Acidobacteriota bacterium]
MKAQPKNETARGLPLAVQAMEGTFAPKEIEANALLEQLSYRAAGNPPGTLPTTAISNCFPGLEFDFRNVWKNIFEGIELHESDNFVVNVIDPKLKKLRYRRLIKIHLPRGEQALITALKGPRTVGGPSRDLGPAALEWANALVFVVREAAGQIVKCEFTRRRAEDAVGADVKTEEFELKVRNFFEPGTAVIARDLVAPGQLTQSLCSPWQNDYLECACYYWAASRPDFVNVDIDANGTSAGENWVQKRGENPGVYVRDGNGLLDYPDLFREWEKNLKFEIRGRDSE